MVGFINGVWLYEEMTDRELRDYPDKETVQSMTSLSQETLNRFVRLELGVDCQNRNDVSRLRNVFGAYHALLRRHGLTWLTDNNPRVAANHVIDAVQPESLRRLLLSDTKFA